MPWIQVLSKWHLELSKSDGDTSYRQIDVLECCKHVAILHHVIRHMSRPDRSGSPSPQNVPALVESGLWWTVLRCRKRKCCIQQASLTWPSLPVHFWDLQLRHQQQHGSKQALMMTLSSHCYQAHTKLACLPASAFSCLPRCLPGCVRT